MIDALTKVEKIRIDAFPGMNMDPTQIAADLIVRRNLLAFIQMVDIVEAYLKEGKRE